MHTAPGAHPRGPPRGNTPCALSVSDHTRSGVPAPLTARTQNPADVADVLRFPFGRVGIPLLSSRARLGRPPGPGGPTPRAPRPGPTALSCGEAARSRSVRTQASPAARPPAPRSTVSPLSTDRLSRGEIYHRGRQIRAPLPWPSRLLVHPQRTRRPPCRPHSPHPRDHRRSLARTVRTFRSPSPLLSPSWFPPLPWPSAHCAQAQRPGETQSDAHPSSPLPASSSRTCVPSSRRAAVVSLCRERPHRAPPCWGRQGQVLGEPLRPELSFPFAQPHPEFLSFILFPLRRFRCSYLVVRPSIRIPQRVTSEERSSVLRGSRQDLGSLPREGGGQASCPLASVYSDPRRKVRGFFSRGN